MLVTIATRRTVAIGLAGLAAFRAVTTTVWPTRRLTEAAGRLIAGIATRATRTLGDKGFRGTAIILKMDAAGTHCASLLDVTSATSAIATGAIGATGIAVTRRAHRTFVAQRRVVGRLAIEIGPCRFRKLLAKLVPQQPRLDHLHATLGQISELERTIGNTDQPVHLQTE